MFTPKTKWNWEVCLIAMSVIDVYLDSIIDNSINTQQEYLDFSQKAMSTVYCLLEDDNISSSLFLLKDKNNETLGTILDCGGELWSIIGKDGPNATLKYLGKDGDHMDAANLVPLELNLSNKEKIKSEPLYTELKRKKIDLNHFSIIQTIEKEPQGFSQGLNSVCFPYESQIENKQFKELENKLNENKNYNMKVLAIGDIPHLTLEKIQKTHEQAYKYNLKQYEPNVDDSEDDTWAMFENSDFCFHIQNENKKLSSLFSNIFNESPTHEFLSLTNAPHISYSTSIPYEKIQVDLSTEEQQKTFIELINFTILAFIPSTLGLRDIKESEKRFSEFSYGIFHIQQINLQEPNLIQKKFFNSNNLMEKIGGLSSPFKKKNHLEFGEIEEIMNVAKFDSELKLRQNLVTSSKTSYGNRF